MTASFLQTTNGAAHSFCIFADDSEKTIQVLRFHLLELEGNFSGFFLLCFPLTPKHIEGRVQNG